MCGSGEERASWSDRAGFHCLFGYFVVLWLQTRYLSSLSLIVPSSEICMSLCLNPVYKKVLLEAPWSCVFFFYQLWIQASGWTREQVSLSVLSHYLPGTSCWTAHIINLGMFSLYHKANYWSFAAHHLAFPDLEKRNRTQNNKWCLSFSFAWGQLWSWHRCEVLKGVLMNGLGPSGPGQSLLRCFWSLGIWRVLCMCVRASACVCCMCACVQKEGATIPLMESKVTF